MHGPCFVVDGTHFAQILRCGKEVRVNVRSIWSRFRATAIFVFDRFLSVYFRGSCSKRSARMPKQACTDVWSKIFFDPSENSGISTDVSAYFYDTIHISGNTRSASSRICTNFPTIYTKWIVRTTCSLARRSYGVSSYLLDFSRRGAHKSSSERSFIRRTALSSVALRCRRTNPKPDV